MCARLTARARVNASAVSEQWVRTCVFFSAFYIQERVSSTYPACTHVRMHACTRASAALPRERSTRDVRERSRMISAKLAAYSHVGISIQLELDMRLTLLLKENSKTVFLVLRKMFWFIINKWKWFIKEKNEKWFIKKKWKMENDLF